MISFSFFGQQTNKLAVATLFLTFCYVVSLILSNKTYHYTILVSRSETMSVQILKKKTDSNYILYFLNSQGFKTYLTLHTYINISIINPLRSEGRQEWSQRSRQRVRILSVLTRFRRSDGHLYCPNLRASPPRHLLWRLAPGSSELFLLKACKSQGI